MRAPSGCDAPGSLLRAQAASAGCAARRARRKASALIGARGVQVVMALRIACQALPAPGAQRSATNVPAFMRPAKSLHARDVGVLASGTPFTSAQREATPGFWRPDCPPDEDEARKGPFSAWPRKVAQKAARLAAEWPSADSRRPAFRSTIEEVGARRRTCRQCRLPVAPHSPHSANKRCAALWCSRCGAFLTYVHCARRSTG